MLLWTEVARLADDDDAGTWILGEDDIVDEVLGPTLVPGRL